MNAQDTRNQLFEFLLDLVRWGVVIVFLLGLTYAIKWLGLNILEPAKLGEPKAAVKNEKKA